MTAGGPSPVTVITDKDDHPAWTTAAHAAHDPARGRLTIDPSPANGAAAALAHDLLYALGKRLPADGDTYGTWADSQHHAWDAVAAWILAHHIGHLIVCRTDRLTHARQKQLLALRERSGIRLTLLWHRPASPALTTLLDGLEHQVIDNLDHTRTVLYTTARSPAATKSTGHDQSTDTMPCHDDGQWITPPPRHGGTRVIRLPRAPCHGADPAALAPATEPEHGDDHSPTAVLATRLARVAHPLYAAALTIHTITGASIDQLALVRGTDIDDTLSLLKTHDSRAHRRCTVHPAPGWARPLLSAAKTYGRLQDRDPDSPLLPFINARNGEHLTAHATAIRYTLDRTTRDDDNHNAQTHHAHTPVTSHNTNPVISTGNQLSRSTAKNDSTRSASMPALKTSTDLS